MTSHRFPLKSISVCLLMGSSLYASSIQWTAQSPNNDMQDSSNWSSNAVPGIADDAVFDSTYPGVELNRSKNPA